MVVTFRNVHNWMGQGTAEQAFASFYKTLKPGGILGVEEHRAANDKPQDPKAANGYVREDYTIALAEKAGFKLVEPLRSARQSEGHQGSREGRVDIAADPGAGRAGHAPSTRPSAKPTTFC